MRVAIILIKLLFLLNYPFVIATNSFQYISSLPIPIDNMAYVSVAGNIYSIGGRSDPDYYRGDMTSTYRYNPEPGYWQERGALINEASSFAACSYNNTYIYAIGTGDDHSSAEVYNINTNQWNLIADVPNPRSELGCAIVNQTLYAIGGEDNSDGSPSNIVDIYDINSDTWSSGIPLPTSLRSFSTSVLNDKIYVIGGSDSSTYQKTVYIFDPEINTWITGTPMPFGRAYHASTVCGGMIFIMGGQAYNDNSNICDTHQTNTVYTYIPSIDIWIQSPSLQGNGSYYLGAGSGDNFIISFGGSDWCSFDDTIETLKTVQKLTLDLTNTSTSPSTSSIIIPTSSRSKSVTPTISKTNIQGSNSTSPMLSNTPTLSESSNNKLNQVQLVVVIIIGIVGGIATILGCIGACIGIGVKLMQFHHVRKQIKSFRTKTDSITFNENSTLIPNENNVIN